MPHFSRDEWSLAIQIAGLAVSFLYGLATQRNARLWPLAFLGLAVNVVAQVLIAGGGPGAFVGFFLLPVYFMLVGALGRGGRWLICGVSGKTFR